MTRPQDDVCAPADAPAGAPPLELDQVTFGYGRVPVLREVSARIGQGELVGVVGPNGSGKTTMMQLALGLLRPTHGTVRLFGQPADRFRRHDLLGYVPQRAAADTVVPISVEEVVRTGLAGSLGALRRPDRRQRERVEHVLDVLGIAGLRRVPVGRLSGGQQQRTLIARALASQPRLLVLDEPTTGVDADARGILRESLEHLVRTEGVAVAYVTHDPEGFRDLADRILELRAGRVVEHRPDRWQSPSPAAPRPVGGPDGAADGGGAGAR